MSGQSLQIKLMVISIFMLIAFWAVPVVAQESVSVKRDSIKKFVAIDW